MLHVALNERIVEATTHKTLRIKDCIRRVGRRHTLRRVTDEALLLRIRDIRGSRAIPLIVCDNLYTVVLPNADTRIGRAEVNTDGRNILHMNISSNKFLSSCRVYIDYLFNSSYEKVLFQEVVNRILEGLFHAVHNCARPNPSEERNCH